MLLEREAELDEIAGALRRAQSGEGAMIMLRGPIGCGKSSLLRALPPLAGGAQVLRASASSLEQDYAFGVVRQLIDPILSAAPADVRERWMTGVAGLSRIIFAADAPPTGGASAAPVREAVLLGMTTLIANINAEIPLLIIVDDVQWTDVPSLHLLTMLAKQVDRMRVLVVAAMRDGDIRANRMLLSELTSLAHRELRPAPFSITATQRFIKESLGEAPDDEFVRACHEISDGSPLILASVTHNVAYHGLSPAAEHAFWVRSLRPGQLRDRLVQCLLAQDPAVLAFARALAVLGENAEPDLIRRLAGLDSVGCGEATRTMYELGLLKDRHDPEFAHLVVQDAIDATMTMPEREQLRLDAVQLLHRSGHPAEHVAGLLLAIASCHDSWAIEILRSAADTAARRGAPEVAVRYLRRALLDTPPDGEARARLLVDLATAERGFDAAAAVRHISYAVPLLPTARDKAAAVVRISPAMLIHDPLPVQDLITEVATELGDPATLTGQDRDLALRLETRLRHSAVGDPAELGAAVRRLAGLDPRPLLETSAERELLTVLLHAATLSTKLTAQEITQLAIPLLERETAAPGHVHTALPLLTLILGSADSAAPLAVWVETALAKARLQEAGVEQALIRAEHALTLLYLGRIGEARSAALEVADLGWSAMSTTASTALSAVALELQDVELANRVLAGDQEPTSDPCSDATRRMLLAFVTAAAGDTRQALDHVLESGARLNRLGWINPVLFPWQSSAAILHHRLGETESALRYAGEARTRAQDWGAPFAIGRALRTLALMTPGEPGTELLREAVVVLETSQNVLERGRAQLQLGSRLRAAGAAGSDDVLQRARQSALECGATALAAKITALLRPAGDGPADAEPRTRLTKSETKVVTLAVDRHTNQEIADILQISCRAVEKHLTNAFRKLGIRRRTELAGALPVAPPSGYELLECENGS